MIADDAGAAASRYRDGVRSTSPMLWALIGIAILSLLLARATRSYGTIGIIVTVVVALLLITLARNLLTSRSRPSGFDRWRATTKNVTPHEPALPPGVGPAPGSDGAAPTPSVIVVEPPDVTDRLSARLQALDRLRADGLVTADEYEAKRAQLIADF